MRNGAIKLKGIVEIDETYMKGKLRKFQSEKYTDIMKFNGYVENKLDDLSNRSIFNNKSVKKNGLIEDVLRDCGTSKFS